MKHQYLPLLLLTTSLMAQHHEPYAGPHGTAHSAPQFRLHPIPKPWAPKRIPMAKRGPIGTLPFGYREYRHPSGPYYFHKGLWYRPFGLQYVLCYPPVGMLVDLPVCRTVVIAGITYFVYQEVYYVKYNDTYQVVEPQIFDVN